MNVVASRLFLADCDHKIQNPESDSYRIPNTFPKKDGESIYIHTTALDRFCRQMLPLIKVKFILYSGDSDKTIPDDYPRASMKILDNYNLIRWYAQNCVKTDHPKLIQLPIGLDLHTLARGNHFWGPQQSSESQMEDMVRLINKNTPKQNKCYGNFQFLLWTRYAQDRKDAIAKIPTNLIFYEPHPVPRNVTWNNMVQYKYVISPHGNGLDCHRTWEAIILGCIPIVKTSPLDPMFEGLPVLIVKDWSDITQELLDTFIPDISKLAKLNRNYWKL